MKEHKGMRPQDIAVLLQLLDVKGHPWLMKDISAATAISLSEVSESINRSKLAGLILPSSKNVNRKALLDFLEYGVKYVFPAQLGSLVRGIPTAHSAVPLNSIINSEETIVWPFNLGKARGQALQPLYPTAPEAASQNQWLYEMLALVDALRLGRKRERAIAMKELQKRILNGE